MSVVLSFDRELLICKERPTTTVTTDC